MQLRKVKKFKPIVFSFFFFFFATILWLILLNQFNYGKEKNTTNHTNNHEPQLNRRYNIIIDHKAYVEMRIDDPELRGLPVAIQILFNPSKGSTVEQQKSSTIFTNIHPQMKLLDLLNGLSYSAFMS